MFTWQNLLMVAGIVCRMNIVMFTWLVHEAYPTYWILILKSTEPATEFASSLLQTLVIEESNVISELQNLVDALAKVCVKNLFLCLPISRHCLQILKHRLLQSLDLLNHCSSWLKLLRILLLMWLLHLVLMSGRTTRPDNLERKRLVSLVFWPTLCVLYNASKWCYFYFLWWNRLLFTLQ